jgi:hypothetical protein
LESFFLKNPDVLWAIEPTRVTKIIANLRNSEFPPDHSRKILSSHWKNGRDADWLEEHAIEHLLSIAESVVAIDDRIHEDAFSFGFKQLPVLTQEETTYVAQHQDRDELLQLLAKVDARVSRQPRSFSAQLG